MLCTCPRTTIELAGEICPLYLAMIRFTALETVPRSVPCHVGRHVKYRLNVVMAQQQRRGRSRNRGEIAKELRAGLSDQRDRRAIQLIHRIHPVLLRLHDHLIADSVLVVQPEVGGGRPAAVQRDGGDCGQALSVKPFCCARVRSVFTIRRGASVICWM